MATAQHNAKHILVTGGAGYIGSHTAIELLEAGYIPVIVDNFSNSSPVVLERIKEVTGAAVACHEADVNDVAALENIFAQYEFDGVIHFAGLKAVGESVAEPLRYYRTNVAGTMSLCEVMQRKGVKKIVFSSTATVYGDPSYDPIPETARLNPQSPYARTKLMVEDILHDVSATDPDWHVSLLRYFNPIGAHPSGRLGEDPQGIPNNLLPFVAQVAVGKRESVSVYGNDYETSDGTGVRDYLHVVDLAKGHIKALQHLSGNSGVGTYNLGTGKGSSVLEVIDSFKKASGKEIPYNVVDRRPGDIAIYFANPSKAERELGWKAGKTLDDMTADTWRWQSQNPNGYRG